MFETLRTHFDQIKDRKIISLFDIAGRAQDFSIRFEDFLFDYSKTNLDKGARNLLLNLFENSNAAQKRDEMFRGEKINSTEGRAVLHVALRNGAGNPIYVNDKDIMTDVLATLASMRLFAEKVRKGVFQGQGGKITDVVNIGIGGSDLGPAMAVLALAPFHDGPDCHFVSNIDSAHLADVLKPLKPETTLVIVASKSFTTIETMTNAQTALQWMGKIVENPTDQFVAVSSATARTKSFGISEDHVFGFGDWVGGRYSVWGPVGLSIMIAIGYKRFQEFLDGAYWLDQHFLKAEPLENLPIMLALIGLWHNQICGYKSRALLPYDQRLHRLPEYIQQLEMESNGKGVSIEGYALHDGSCPVVWGASGTNGQHAFYQFLHQGTQIVPTEFLVAAQGHEPELAHHHTLLLANCIAQSQALMRGRSFKEALELASQKGFKNEQQRYQAHHLFSPGNRPSTTLIYPKLTPKILGAIIAIYEHRVFVEGAILGINSYDQWGVELGKELASQMVAELELGGISGRQDPSTQQLINYIHAKRG